MCILRNERRASAVLVVARRPDPSRVLLKVWLDRPKMLPLRSRAIESPLELVVVVPTMRFCPSRSVKSFMSFLRGHHSTGHLEPTDGHRRLWNLAETILCWRTKVLFYIREFGGQDEDASDAWELMTPAAKQELDTPIRSLRKRFFIRL